MKWKEGNVPQNGEVNKRLGIYKSLCCGYEILLREGAVFPECPNHRNLPTTWKSISGGPIPRATELHPKKKDNDPAA